MPTQKLDRAMDLQHQIDAEYAHVQDISDWWGKVLEAMWQAANDECRPETIRPFLNNLQRRLRSIPLPSPSQRQSS